MYRIQRPISYLYALYHCLGLGHLLWARASVVWPMLKSTHTQRIDKYYEWSLTFYRTPSGTNNRIQLQTVMADRNTPVTVLVGDDKHPFHLNEQQLCACSPFFHSVLIDGFNEPTIASLCDQGLLLTYDPYNKISTGFINCSCKYTLASFKVFSWIKAHTIK